MPDEPEQPESHEPESAYERLSKRRLEFLQKTVAKGATNAELGHFLELCAKYDLDPFAKEVWLAVSDKNGKRNVLLMVGRDGLRKIAMRQGFVIDGDVVHENDDFTVTRNPDRSRTITHVYAPKDRGPVLGAWAEVYASDGRQRGYFYALMSEYRPTSPAKLQYSPWGSQESVMILAAAERTALGMATPLSGVLAPGELDAGEERRQLGAGTGNGEAEGLDLGPAVEEVIARATEAGYAAYMDRASIEVALGDQPPQFVEAWVKDAHKALDGFEADSDAEVVSGDAA